MIRQSEQFPSELSLYKIIIIFLLNNYLSICDCCKYFI